MLIDDDLDTSWMYSMVKDELVEEDLKLRKKLDDLEQGLFKLSKELKPTLLTMEEELKLITEDVKKDWEIIESLYDKLLETRRGFQITKEALADWLNIDIESEELNDLVKENQDEANELDKDV